MSALDIAAWAKKTRVDVEKASKAIKIELGSSVIEDTRVNTGRMRGGWTTNEGFTPGDEITRFDKSGEAAKQELMAKASAIGVTHITNNVPYAPHWEEIDGMVRKNMARIQAIIRKVTK